MFPLYTVTPSPILRRENVCCHTKYSNCATATVVFTVTLQSELSRHSAGTYSSIVRLGKLPSSYSKAALRR